MKEGESMLFLQNDEIVNIFRSLIDWIKENDIDIIIPLAKKGSQFFDYLQSQDLSIVKEFNNMNLDVKSDREINTNDNYEFLHGKKILLFDDSVKTGEHFIHTANYLREKINKKFSLENDDFTFYFFAYIKCKDTKLNSNIDKTKLYIYDEKASIKEYFEFCHKESTYFQRKLIPTSTNLPIFKTTVEDIQLLKNILLSNDNFQFNDTSFRIANEEFDLGVLIINDFPLKEIIGSFLISATCKIRYEYNILNKNYDVIFTPFAICDSIKYEELELLYNLVFKKNVNSKTKSEMNCVFVRLYRKVIYLISYFIGDIIKNYLNSFHIYLNYPELDEDIKSVVNNYQNGVYTFFDLNFNYTPKANFQMSLALTLKQIKIYLYDRIVRKNSSSNNHKFNQLNYEYNFVELNTLADIYTNPANCLNFISALFIYLENYSISNEIEFNYDTCWIDRGISAGESSISTLPFYDALFYFGLYSFYQRIHQDFKLYKQNFDIFVNKLFIFFKNEDYFSSSYMSVGDFDYLCKYYSEVNENNFNMIIESKSYLLDNQNIREKSAYLKRWMDFILESDDYTYYESD